MQALVDSTVAFLTQPFAAGLLGVLLGVLLIWLTRTGVRFMAPEQPELGVARAVALMMLGLVLAFAALLLFYLFAREGLVAFGLGLVAGFIVPAFIALFALSGVVKASS